VKNGKKPTRRQKMAIRAINLNPDNWFVYKTDATWIHLVHRYTSTTRSIPN